MSKSASSTRYPLWRRIIKILLWTVMALVLLVAGTLICCVNMLHPRHLTPLVERVASSQLQARVELARVALGLRATFPFLTIEADSLAVISRDMQDAPHSVRSALPAYADTLLTLRRLRGGISLTALAAGEISLSDIMIDEPAVNVVTGPGGLCNYNIVPSDSTDTGSTEIPTLRITRFELRNPRPMRYYDGSNPAAPDSLIVELRPAALTSDGAPQYTLNFGGNLHMPMLGEYNLWKLPFSFDGGLRWDPADPSRLRLENVSAAAAFVDSRFTADVDFADPLTLHELDFELRPVAIDTLLSCLSDSMRLAMPALAELHTDATAGLAVKLTRPFNTLTDSIPWADVVLDVPPCRVQMGPASFHDVEARMSCTLRGNDLSAATLDIRRLHVAGPATKLTLTGTLSDITDDPYFDGRIEGYSDLRRLPPRLLNLINGSLQGTLRADMNLSGRPSMFGRDGFHLLRASGRLSGSEIYWLGADTARAAYVRHASLDFGTSSSVAGADSLLHAVVKLDSASYLDHGISVRATGLSLGVGAANRHRSADTTVIIPMGGGLSIASMRVLSMGDSAGMVARDLRGRVTMRRYKGEERRPEFAVEMNGGRIAAGSPDVRFLLTDALIEATAHQLPLTGMQKKVRHTADSLHLRHPELPLDSVYALAARMHRRRPHKQPRVHAEVTTDDREIIDWGTSRGLRRLLTGWDLRGSVKAKRAALYTPSFPLRNRVRNFNVTFNTDSVLLNNVEYKVGHSDFTMSGRITNIKRAFTSRGWTQPLRMHFDVASDTVDVNQLAAAIFAGAAYNQRKQQTQHRQNLGSLEMDIENDELPLTRDSGEAAGPVLIPENIDAEISLSARNVLYSDLLLHDLTGSALMYDGRLNFHNLRAAGDLGSIDLSALYSAPKATDMQFGFGLVLEGFNVERFLHLVPAIDSIMPLMRDISGIIDANIAATVDVKPDMDLDLNTLNAAVRLQGDSLRLLDGETHRTLAKWLMFKDKNKNMIDSMSVELLIDKGMMELFPFVFNFDRYRLGVQGYNDMALNFDYHIAVLKSPLPFKFGITLKGNPDDYKVRLGKARFNERTAFTRPAVVDTTRVNLLRQIEGVFRRGVKNSRLTPLHFSTRPQAVTIDLHSDTLTRADSLVLMREGLIPQMQ